jgi:hypothetical protein
VGVVSDCYFAHGVTSVVVDTLSPCQRWQHCYYLGRVPASDRRRCPCFCCWFRLLWIGVCVAVVFLSRWVGGVDFVPIDGLRVCGWCFKGGGGRLLG